MRNPPDPARPSTLVASPEADRSGVLLQIAQAVAAHADLADLLRDLASALGDHLPPGYLSFALVDPATRGAKLQYLEPVGRVPPPARADIPTELSATESPASHVWVHQDPLWLDIDDSSDRRFPILRAAFGRQGVRAGCFVPLTTPRRRLGALGITSYTPLRSDPRDIEFAAQIGRLVALAVEATLTRQELERAHANEAKERGRLELLYEIGQAAASRLDMTGLSHAVTAGLRKLAEFPAVTLFLPDEDGMHLRVVAEGSSDSGRSRPLLSIADTSTGKAFRTGRIVRVSAAGQESGLIPSESSGSVDGRAYAAIPLRCGGAAVGVLGVISPDATGFGDDAIELLEAVARPVAVAVANARAYREIEKLTARLSAEKHYLEEEIRSEWDTDEMIGGRVLGEVLRQVEVVARTDSAVLITGETGTGKELIARAVHRRSERRERTFVKLNCAAIPTGLLESELFGHEKGAFTGAVDRRIGRFELANGGTLFLDEVGDIPQELQPKLLRVLQEQEFERLGSAKTIRVDVRLVAATHRNLARMVAEGTFRSDLYYRLHVFPIHIPPLRERRGDIPLLVRHFARAFARRFGKSIDSIPAEAMSALEGYSWPGNVRELEHLIERAVILSSESELRVPVAELLAHPSRPGGGEATVIPSMRGLTLKENERDLIARTLEECRWVIGGRNGAAARLGLKRTTLLSRMKKLGLERIDPSDVN